VPVHKVKGGWQWGKHGKVYKAKKDAVRQARAAYAHGYHESLQRLINEARSLLS
jgi:hypothetical protein